MAEDVIDRAEPLAGLAHIASRTTDLRLHGWTTKPAARNEWECVYGSDLPLLDAVAGEKPEFNESLHPALPFRKAEVVWATRYEMARTVEDVLARRTRALFLDAAASMEAAPVAARLMAGELQRDERWAEQQAASFRKLAQGYIWNNAA